MPGRSTTSFHVSLYSSKLAWISYFLFRLICSSNLVFRIYWLPIGKVTSTPLKPMPREGNHQPLSLIYFSLIQWLVGVSNFNHLFFVGTEAREKFIHQRFITCFTRAVPYYWYLKEICTTWYSFLNFGFSLCGAAMGDLCVCSHTDVQPMSISKNHMAAPEDYRLIPCHNL
jgi:hypothetical protein